MQRLVCGVFIVGVALLICCRGERTTVETAPKITPTVSSPVTTEIPDGPVRDEAVAIKIALNMWIPIYGQDQIEKEKPYKAELKNGVWTVEGSLPQGWDGGVAIARISQKDGKVLETGHSK